MRERIQKILAGHGVASRRAAEQMILDGRVTVNRAPACLGQSADDERDEICLDGLPLGARERATYVMLHKPRGYVTTLSDEKGRRSVAELVAELPVRLYPVGRLDMDSEGLLIMTNDGQLAHRLMHPSHEVEKCYHVWVVGEDIPAAAAALRQPMDIDGRPIRPARVSLLKAEGGCAVLAITIHEGRNRQIRKMCASCGLKISRLKRVSEGQLRLGKLASGHWRYLTRAEVDSLRKL